MNEYSNLSSKSRYVDIVNSQNEMWKTIFSLSAKDVDFSKPLTHKILSNPDNDFVKTIVYLYSMESFIY